MPTKPRSRKTKSPQGLEKYLWSKKLSWLIILLAVFILALIVIFMVMASFNLSTYSDRIRLTHRMQGQNPAGLPASSTQQASLSPVGKLTGTGTATLTQSGTRVTLNVSAQGLAKPTSKQQYSVYLVGDTTSPTKLVFVGNIVGMTINGKFSYDLQGIGPVDWFRAQAIEIHLQITTSKTQGTAVLKGNFTSSN